MALVKEISHRGRYASFAGPVYEYETYQYSPIRVPYLVNPSNILVRMKPSVFKPNGQMLKSENIQIRADSVNFYPNTVRATVEELLTRLAQKEGIDLPKDQEMRSITFMHTLKILREDNPALINSIHELKFPVFTKGTYFVILDMISQLDNQHLGRIGTKLAVEMNKGLYHVELPVNLHYGGYTSEPTSTFQ